MSYLIKMRVVILILLGLVLALNANALSVASDYLENDRLTLIEGTSKIYSIRLQNPDSFESTIRIDYDKDYMQAIDFKEEFTLPPKSSIRIEFNVIAPEYDKNKNLLPISYTVHQISGAGGSGASFLGKINKNFQLEVIRNPDRVYLDRNYIIIGIIIGAIVLALLLYILRKNIMSFWKSPDKASKSGFKSRKLIKWKH